jgi:hypothetical protein
VDFKLNQTSKKCKCGFDRNHMMVSREGKYSALDWFFVTIVGITTKPKEIKFRCRVCEEVFDFVNTPQEIEQYYS